MDNFTFGQFAELQTYEDRAEYEAWLDGGTRGKRYRKVWLNPDAVAVERFSHNRGWVQQTSFSGIFPESRADRWIADQERLDELDNA
jgi:hypothetical protein